MLFKDTDPIYEITFKSISGHFSGNYNGLDIKPSLSTRNGLYNHHAGTPSLGKFMN